MKMLELNLVVAVGDTSKALVVLDKIVTIKETNDTTSILGLDDGNQVQVVETNEEIVSIIVLALNTTDSLAYPVFSLADVQQTPNV